MNLSDEQIRAVDLCSDLHERMVCITGPAGTGKTTILRNVHDELHQSRRVCLVAPTGRAAKRIQEATGIEARTIHRFLEFPAPFEIEESKGKLKFGEPKRNRWNTIPCDVLLIDEASMLTEELNDYIIDALPTHATIRYFGDANQLPPIEQGRSQSLFEEYLTTKESITLTHNFRSGDDLIENANRILNGRIPRRSEKFEIIITADPIGALSHVATREFAATNNQVLTPKRQHQVGSISLSSIMRQRFNLNLNASRITLNRLRDDEDDLTVFQDDKVLWTKNDYVLNVMNGELGTIDAIDDGTIALILDDGRYLTVPPSVKSPFGGMYDPRKQIDLAYCMTTHKAQGSEFDTVIYVMHKSQAWMLDRNNFYTAVTRAKKRVIVIADTRSLQLSMRKRRKGR